MKRKTHNLVVILLLALHAVFAFTSMVKKSTTYDEVAHLTAGYSHWKYGDFRLITEHPPLTFLWASLPLVITQPSFPSLNQKCWEESDAWNTAWQFFNECGNDARSMLLSGRLMSLFFSLGLGVLVYAISTRFFGREGGLVSLLLYSFSPTMLAHGRLVTTDTAASLFFLASVVGIWWVVHRITLKSILFCILSVTCLFLSKFSAVLILPMAGIMILVRLASKRPVYLGKGEVKVITSWWQKLAIFLALSILQAAMVFVSLWLFHGFRYSAFQEGDTNKARFEIRYRRKAGQTPWDYLMEEKGKSAPVIKWARDKKILPEAFLYGFIYALRTTEERAAFLNGDIRIRGWWHYFPYTFLVKTPLPLFGVLLFALMALLYPRLFPSLEDTPPEVKGMIPGRLYHTIPLWTLFALYWAVSIRTKLNIGHRHILPIYPVLFVLAGAAVVGWRSRRPVLRWGTRGMVGLFLLASLTIWPHYLSYFNLLAGGPSNGYRRLVDSSLDWGQDLPALKKVLEKRDARDTFNVTYLSYFGMGNPADYHIGAKYLPGVPDRETLPPYRLGGGLYCVSATMLQQVYSLPSNRWTKSMEKAYQECRFLIHELEGTENNPGQRKRLIQELGSDFWNNMINVYHKLRLGRLCFLLRNKEPEGNAGYSILIYRVSDKEVRKAIEGPPPELAPEPAYLKTHPNLRISSPLARAHLLRGVSAAGRGRLDKAIEHFRKSLDLEPDSLEARQYLQKALQEKRENKELKN